jgi:hypothetical protein
MITDGLLENTNPLLNDPESTRFFDARFQRGTSMKVLEQISQIGRSGRFQYFDYGTEGNIQEYGTEEVPVFPLDQINVPIALLQGKFVNLIILVANADGVLGEQDNQWIADQLDDQLIFYQEYYMTHIGFLVGRDMSYLEDVSNILAAIY